MEDGGNGEVPSSVSGHQKTKKGPDSVVPKGRNEHSSGTASPKDVRPSSLVQVIIYVINITAYQKKKRKERKRGSIMPS